MSCGGSMKKYQAGGTTSSGNQGMGYKKESNPNTLAKKLSKTGTTGQGMGYKKEGNTNTLAKQLQKKKKGGFPDLTGDGKVTRADILKGRGVIKKSGGSVKKK